MARVNGFVLKPDCRKRHRDRPGSVRSTPPAPAAPGFELKVVCTSGGSAFGDTAVYDPVLFRTFPVPRAWSTSAPYVFGFAQCGIWMLCFHSEPRAPSRCRAGETQDGHVCVPRGSGVCSGARLDLLSTSSCKRFLSAVEGLSPPSAPKNPGAGN